MSCYVVSNETLFSVASFIYSYCFNSKYGFYTDKTYLDKYDYNYKNLVLDMYTLNTNAFNSRYPNHKDELSDQICFDNLRDMPHHDTIVNMSKYDIYQFLKLTDHYLYQCSEDLELPEDKKLFDAIDTFRNDMYKHIVSENELYKKAKWGIE